MNYYVGSHGEVINTPSDKILVQKWVNLTNGEFEWRNLPCEILGINSPTTSVNSATS